MNDIAQPCGARVARTIGVARVVFGLGLPMADAAQRAMVTHLDHLLDEIELRAAENPDIFAPASDRRRT